LRRLKENRIGLGGINSTGPINKRYHSKYISGYESGGYSGNADSTFSSRLGNTYQDEDCYSYDEVDEFDEELEYINELSIKTSIISYRSRSLILEASGTDIIAEGALIEMGKIALADVVKNLLASGAVVLSGGLAGDTIVEILYAIERTKTVLDIIDSLKQGSQIISNFFNKMQNVKLENNLDAIKEISMTVIAELALVYDNVIDDGSFALNLSEIKEARESVKLIQKVKKVFEEIREKMLEFARSSISAIADWISTFIPDDGGNVGTAIKTVLVGAIEKASGSPYTVLKTAISGLPGEFSTLALSESKLNEYLTDMSLQVADGIEKFTKDEDFIEHGQGFIEKGIKGLAHLESEYFNALDKYTPVGKVYDIAGGAAQSAGDFFGGDNSKIGKVGKAIFDPRYRTKTTEKLIDQGFELIKQFPNYIRNTIVPMIPKAVDFYARIMVYMSSFASLIETLASGELESFIEKFDPEKLTKKKKGSKQVRNMLGQASDIFLDALISKDPKDQKAMSESYKLIEYYDDDEEESFEDIDEMSAGGVAGVATPLGTNSKGKVPTRKEYQNRLNHASFAFGGN
jgi:hypothetical protein